MFGTSGIRGIANEDITPEFALQVGRACGTLQENIVVGRDPRTSSYMIQTAFVAGALSTGAQVTDIGLVTTPTLAYATKNYDVGVMITASHNPSMYTGLKFFNPDGSGYSPQQSLEIEKNLEGKKAKWNHLHTLQEYTGAVQDHLTAILDSIGSLHQSKKVILDCSNGATGTITPFMLEKMGCSVITLNAQPDGFFPGHDPEPIEKNLTHLINITRLLKCIGLAHDCDGDRTVVVYKGNLIPSDTIIALLAKYLHKKHIVVPLNTSQSLNIYLSNTDIIQTQIGDTFISQKLKECNGDFGGEPSGTFVFPSFSYCPDGIFAAAQIMKMFDEINIDDELCHVPHYWKFVGSVSLGKKHSGSVTQKIIEKLDAFSYLKKSTLDGIRMDLEDSWFLVRPSGTEPKIRVTVESKKQVTGKHLYKKLVDIVKECMK